MTEASRGACTWEPTALAVGDLNRASVCSGPDDDQMKGGSANVRLDAADHDAVQEASAQIAGGRCEISTSIA